MSKRHATEASTVGRNESKPDKTSPANAKGSVLVVDDDLEMQSLLSDLLSAAGYSVYCHSDALSALEYVSVEEQSAIDVAVCDITMPRMGGLEFIAELSKMDIKIPVILITAFGTNMLSRECLKKGAYAYVSKPFELAMIELLVEQAVQHSKKQRA